MPTGTVAPPSTSFFVASNASAFRQTAVGGAVVQKGAPLIVLHPLLPASGGGNGAGSAKVQLQGPGGEVVATL